MSTIGVVNEAKELDQRLIDEADMHDHHPPSPPGYASCMGVHRRRCF